MPSLNQVLGEIPAVESSPTDSAEQRWFAHLVETYGAAVLSLLRRLCRHAQDAEDVFQETAVRVWRSRQAQPAVNVRAWLLTVAYHAFLDHRVRRQRSLAELHGQSDFPTEDVIDFRVSAPLEVAVQNELVERMNAAVRRLPDGVQDVVALHYSGGLSLSETAEAMGVSPGTVKSRLNTALKQLRSVLQ